MSFANAEKMLTKLKEIKGMKKAQGTTLYISNGGQSAINEINMYNLTTVQLCELVQ